MVKKYMIVQKDNVVDLMLEVNKYIDDGWEPLGGLVAESYKLFKVYQSYFYQAMIKKGDISYEEKQ